MSCTLTHGSPDGTLYLAEHSENLGNKHGGFMRTRITNITQPTIYYKKECYIKRILDVCDIQFLKRISYPIVCADGKVLLHCRYKSLYASVFATYKKKIKCSHVLFTRMWPHGCSWQEIVFNQRCGLACPFRVVSMSYWTFAAKISLTAVVP